MVGEYYIERFKSMFRPKRKLTQNDLPEGMYFSNVSLDSDINYDLLREMLPKDSQIRIYEALTGIKMPKEYRGNYHKDKSMYQKR